MDATIKTPKNLQAVLDWCDAHRPDLKPVIEHERNNEGFILLMSVGFEAGRQFQASNPVDGDGKTLPLNQPHLYWE